MNDELCNLYHIAGFEAHSSAYYKSRYYKKDYDPGCFESFSESESELDTYRRSIDQNYFDTLINNF